MATEEKYEGSQQRLDSLLAHNNDSSIFYSYIIAQSNFKYIRGKIIMFIIYIMISFICTYCMNVDTKYHALQNNIYRFHTNYFVYIDSSKCDGIHLNNIYELEQLKSSFGVSFWFNHDLLESDNINKSEIFSMKTNDNIYAIGLVGNEKKIFFSINSIMHNSSKHFSKFDNEWFHCMVLVNGNKIKLFIDGKLNDEFNHSNTNQCTDDNKAKTLKNNAIFVGNDEYKGYVAHITIWYRRIHLLQEDEIYDDFKYAYDMRKHYHLRGYLELYFPLNCHTRNDLNIYEEIGKEYKYIINNKNNYNNIEWKDVGVISNSYKMALLICGILISIMATSSLIKKHGISLPGDDLFDEINNEFQQNDQVSFDKIQKGYAFLFGVAYYQSLSIFKYPMAGNKNLFGVREDVLNYNDLFKGHGWTVKPDINKDNINKNLEYDEDAFDEFKKKTKKKVKDIQDRNDPDVGIVIAICCHGVNSDDIVLSDGSYINLISFMHEINECSSTIPKVYLIDKCRLKKATFKQSIVDNIIYYFTPIIIYTFICFFDVYHSQELQHQIGPLPELPTYSVDIINILLCGWLIGIPTSKNLTTTVDHQTPYIFTALMLLYVFTLIYNHYYLYAWMLTFCRVAWYAWYAILLKQSENIGISARIYGTRDGKIGFEDEKTGGNFSKTVIEEFRTEFQRRQTDKRGLKRIMDDINGRVKQQRCESFIPLIMQEVKLHHNANR